MKKVILMAALLSGCATHSGVIPEGKEGYLILLSGGYGFASATDLKIAAHKEANAFCAGLNKRPETLSEKNAQPGILSDFSEEELKFRCIANPDSPAVSGDAR
ncbi:MAG: hypothetical protein HKM00_03140 [Gallionella sp.]|jgi:hypothetical protein|nr:hypothetical protein [Gallionella sp.]